MYRAERIDADKCKCKYQRVVLPSPAGVGWRGKIHSSVRTAVDVRAPVKKRQLDIQHEYV
jgi:hypothetical protein